MNFTQYFYRLDEALPLGIAKKYTAMSKGKFETLLNDVFQKFGSGKGKYRIYLPDVITKKEISPEEHVPYQKIKKFIEPKGYKIIDYTQGTAGDERKNIHRIGRILNKYVVVEPEARELLSVFETDPVRRSKGIDEFRIVISKHPYDVAGMSTDRSWTSCMQLNTPFIKHKPRKSENEKPEEGIMVDNLKADVLKGTMVAYLIKPDDTNIEYPIARLTIKPYRGDQGDDYYYVSRITYGDGIAEFRSIVETWVNDNINTNLKSSKYEISSKLYKDADDPRIIERNPETGKILHIQPLDQSVNKLVSSTIDENGMFHSTNDVPAVVYDSGDKYWYTHGELDRRNDLPAIEYGNGDKEWYQMGELHRSKNPAVIHNDGTKKWYQFGKLHRDNDLPAIIESDFEGTVTKSWYISGLRNRKNGPAIETSKGKKIYYKDDKKHRDDGPAVIYPIMGAQEYWLNGYNYTPEEFRKLKGIKI